jgi:thioredoxin-like negative regulator of GroEL
LDRISQEYQDKLDLVKVDADKPENEDLLRQFDVKSIPTLVLLAGDTVVGVKVGQTSEIALREWIDDALEGVYSNG